MFQEEILQAKSMIRRLDLEKGKSPSEIEALPVEDRVPMAEAIAWHKIVENKINTNFGVATINRFKSINELYSIEVREQDSNGLSPAETANRRFKRIVSLLSELEDSMLNIKQNNAVIYFSYAWGDSNELGESRENIINELYDSLKMDNFEIRRDKMNVEYGGMISKFMEEIGQGDLIIVGMSTKYLLSPYCMWELCEIYRNCAADKVKFAKHILPIRIENIDISSPTFFREHLTYWQKKFDEYTAFVTDFPQQIGEVQLQEFKKIRTIKDKFADIIGIFQDLNSKTNVILRDADFAELKNVIIQRIKGSQ